MQVELNDDEKRCSHCGIIRRKSDFTKSYKTKDGYDYSCKICRKERNASYDAVHREQTNIRSREAYKRRKEGIKRPVFSPEAARQRDLEKSREWQMKNKYGISREDFTRMWESQDGKCVGCGCKLELTKSGYAIDHNHETGKVRSILCRMCNRVLGLLKENPQTFISLARYLEYHDSDNLRPT